MKQQFITILPAFLFQLVFSACGPREVDCPGAENNYINLTADELSKVPYTGTDTLYFLDHNNDTHIVAGQGRQYYYDSEPIFFHPECPNDRFNWYQAYKTDYLPLKGKLAFQVFQVKKDYDILIKKSSYDIDFVIEFFVVGFGNPDLPDSIVINNHKYGNVNIASSRIRNTYRYDTTYRAYYNKSHGLLFLKSEKDQEAYSILNR